MSPRTRVIGLISDTHGLVRANVHEALSGVELILHAGDVGGADVLTELGTIAPVKAVYGNTDPPDGPGLAQKVEITLEGVRIHVSHGHEVGRPTPDKLAEQYEADVVVYGHTHQQLITRISNRLIVNPGAAGPRRFNLKPRVARLTISEGNAEVEIIDLS